ncbi:MAG TPA: tripartite tricarboxylate transporter substrate binding protein, partial [Burkholderiales bacterium]|nr:tripartite tricarboxylate transporter substrate binding protein [Burkholderiales bacterium]
MTKLIKLLAALTVAAATGGVAPGIAHAQTWKPDNAVEIIAPSAAGGGTDHTARVMQKIIQDQRLLDVPVSVVNKPGGGGSVALIYLKQHAGNGHHAEVASAVLLTNHIVGRSPLSYTDFTPIALLQ